MKTKIVKSNGFYYGFYYNPKKLGWQRITGPYGYYTKFMCNKKIEEWILKNL